MTARRLRLGGGAAVATFALVAFGLWYLFIRDDAPPPVSLADAVVAAPATASSTGAPEDGLVGIWRVASDGESFVGYRVEEVLARIGAHTAVGRTAAVTGSLEFDGVEITTVTIEADLTQLASDEQRRDDTLRRRVLETSSFPTATFALTQPIALDAVLEEGVPFVATAVGELTLHGLTRTVEVALEGQITNGLAVIVGSTTIEFADYDMDPPTFSFILSIEDRGVMEFQLIFERVSAQESRTPTLAPRASGQAPTGGFAGGFAQLDETQVEGLFACLAGRGIGVPDGASVSELFGDAPPSSELQVALGECATEAGFPSLGGRAGGQGFGGAGDRQALSECLRAEGLDIVEFTPSGRGRGVAGGGGPLAGLDLDNPDVQAALEVCAPGFGPSGGGE